MFQFTHPGKGATHWFHNCLLGIKFQFTHPGKGATSQTLALKLWLPCFNSRTLGRVRLVTSAAALPPCGFQFTHPGKGATESADFFLLTAEVSIHAPWEGCDRHRLRGAGLPYRVSIHAPWEGCDLSLATSTACFRRVQFTHPGKGATYGLTLLHGTQGVSIHAPWEGCD